MRKFIRIIFYGLIDSFCLNTIKISDIAIQQDALATQFNNQSFKFSNFANVLISGHPLHNSFFGLC